MKDANKKQLNFAYSSSGREGTMKYSGHVFEINDKRCNSYWIKEIKTKPIFLFHVMAK